MNVVIINRVECTRIIMIEKISAKVVLFYILLVALAVLIKALMVAYDTIEARPYN